MGTRVEMSGPRRPTKKGAIYPIPDYLAKLVPTDRISPSPLEALPHDVSLRSRWGHSQRGLLLSLRLSQLLLIQGLLVLVLLMSLEVFESKLGSILFGVGNEVAIIPIAGRIRLAVDLNSCRPSSSTSASVRSNRVHWSLKAVSSAKLFKPGLPRTYGSPVRIHGWLVQRGISHIPNG